MDAPPTPFTPMKNSVALPLSVIFAFLAGGCACRPEISVPDAGALVAERLPLYGHRNWIVVTDSAYPAQSAPGIETVYVGGSHEDAVRRVLAAMEGAKHVRPTVHLDAELAHVPESAAPGVGALRTKLAAALAGARPKTLPHEEIIRKLDEVSKTYRVLIIKTDGVMAYSSVFFELECGYWSEKSERELREAMKAGGK
jgi:hypothetical protein